MATATDLIGAVYNSLAGTLNLTASKLECLQLAWPGYCLSPADFKPASAPTGPYDSDVARETFSHLANMAPVFDRFKFENSGYEVDDLYDILLASAIPVGATPETVGANPLYRLFSDAQFEFMQARLGYKEDPNAFYYPCRATPVNWYDEAAAAFWPAMNLRADQVEGGAGAGSAFVKAGGVARANADGWKLRPDVASEATLRRAIEQKLDAKAQANRLRLAPTTVATRPLNGSVAAASRAVNASLSANLAVAGAPAGLRPALLAGAAAPGIAIHPGLTRSPAFVDSLGAARASSLFKVKNLPLDVAASPALKDVARQLDLGQAELPPTLKTKVNLAQRILLTDLVRAQLPAKPVQPTTTGFSVTCKFCRVNIDRPWLKLALLSNPGWYMFNTAASEYGTGRLEENGGMFPLLPTAFVAIRDLQITASWSAEDRAAGNNALAFGPFDLRDARFEGNTLQVPGLQLFAWVSRLMPAMPPQAAP